MLLLSIILCLLLIILFYPKSTSKIVYGDTYIPPSKNIEKNKSSEMLKTYYVNAKKHIPDDYPKKEIGDCPYTKPQKEDMPIMNIPMCIAEKSESMKLTSH